MTEGRTTVEAGQPHVKGLLIIQLRGPRIEFTPLRPAGTGAPPRANCDRHRDRGASGGRAPWLSGSSRHRRRAPCARLDTDGVSALDVEGAPGGAGAAASRRGPDLARRTLATPR